MRSVPRLAKSPPEESQRLSRGFSAQVYWAPLGPGATPEIKKGALRISIPCRVLLAGCCSATPVLTEFNLS